MKNWGKYLFLLVCAVSVFLRFARPDLMLFNRDEADLLLMAEQAIKSGVWPIHGLEGTKGIFYGPVPVTLFILIGSTLSDLQSLPMAIFYVSNILHLASLGFLIYSVLKSQKNVTIQLVTACNEQNPIEQGICEKRAEFTTVNEYRDAANNAVILGDCHCLEKSLNGYKKTNLVYLVLAFMLTSPHLIFYARSAWDNPYLMVFSNVLIGLMLLKNGNTGDNRFVLVLMGILLALCLGTHLMAIPLCGVIAVYLWINRITIKKFTMNLLLVGATCLAILGPYFYATYLSIIASKGSEQGPLKLTRFLTGFREVVINWADRATGAGLSDFVAKDQVWNFNSELFGSNFFGPAFYFTMIFVEVGFGILVIKSVLGFKKNHQQLNKNSFKIGLIAITTLLIHFGFAVLCDAVAEPHYLQAVWWAPYLILIVMCDCMQELPQKAMKGFLCFATILNLYALLGFGNLINRKSGYPSLYLGSTISEQARSLVHLCKQNSASIKIDFKQAKPAVCHNCTRWHFLHLEACKANQIYDSNIEGLHSFFAEDGTAKISWVH